MALGTEVVDLIRLNLLDNSNQVGAVGEIAVMKSEPWVALMGVLVEVIDPAGVKRGSSPLDPVPDSPSPAGVQPDNCRLAQ